MHSRFSNRNLYFACQAGRHFFDCNIKISCQSIKAWDSKLQIMLMWDGGWKCLPWLCVNEVCLSAEISWNLTDKKIIFLVPCVKSLVCQTQIFPLYLKNTMTFIICQKNCTWKNFQLRRLCHIFKLKHKSSVCRFTVTHKSWEHDVSVKNTNWWSDWWESWCSTGLV